MRHLPCRRADVGSAIPWKSLKEGRTRPGPAPESRRSAHWKADHQSARQRSSCWQKWRWIRWPTAVKGRTADSGQTFVFASARILGSALRVRVPRNRRFTTNERSVAKPCDVWRPQGDSNPCRRRERAVSWASRRWGRRNPKISSSGGARRDRTVDLLHAMQALSQLSYGPTRGAANYGPDSAMSSKQKRLHHTAVD